MSHPLSTVCNAPVSFHQFSWHAGDVCLDESSMSDADLSLLAKDIFENPFYSPPETPSSASSENTSTQNFSDWASATWEGLGASFKERVESVWDAVIGEPQPRYGYVKPEEWPANQKAWPFQKEEFYDWVQVEKERIANCWGGLSKWRSATADGTNIIWNKRGYFTEEKSPYYRGYEEYYGKELCEERQGCCFDPRNENYPKLSPYFCYTTLEETPRPRPAWYIVMPYDANSIDCAPNKYGHPICSGHYAYVTGKKVIVHTRTEKEHNDRVGVCKSLEDDLAKKFEASTYYGEKNINTILNSFYEWIEAKAGDSLEVRKREAWRLRMGGLMPAMHNLLGKPGDETLTFPLEQISVEGSEHLGPEYGEEASLRKWVYALAEWWTQFHANMETAQTQLDAKHLPGWRAFQKWEVALGVKDKGMSMQCTYPLKLATCHGSFTSTTCARELYGKGSRVKYEDIIKFKMGPPAQATDTFSYRETSLPCVPEKPGDAAPSVEDLVKWRLEDYKEWVAFQDQIKEYSKEVGEEKVREFDRFFTCEYPIYLKNVEWEDRVHSEGFFAVWEEEYIKEQKIRSGMDDLYNEAIESGDLNAAEQWTYNEYPCRQHYQRPEPSVGPTSSSVPGSGNEKPDPNTESDSSLSLQGITGTTLGTLTAVGIWIRRKMGLANVTKVQISQVTGAISPTRPPGPDALNFFSISSQYFSTILSYIQALFEWIGGGSNKGK